MKEFLIERDPRLPICSLFIGVPVGAASDAPTRKGLASLSTSLLRRGTATLSAIDIETRLDSIGAEVSPGAGMGWSFLSCEVLSRSADQLVDLLVRMLSEPCRDEDELHKLKRQTHAEIVEGRDDDGLLAYRAMRRTLFGQHPHGGSSKGTLAGLDSIDLTDVDRHQRMYFSGKAAVFAWSGDIEEAAALRLSERIEAAMSSETPPTPAIPEPDPQHPRRICLVDKADRQLTHLVVGTLGTKVSDPDHVALTIANTALGGTFSSRLMQEIRAKRGLSYGASSQLLTSHIREAFSCATSTALPQAGVCLKLLLSLLDSWTRDGLTEEELTFCKRYLARSHAFEIDTAKKRVHRRLRNVMLGMDKHWSDGYLEAIAAVTLDEANAAIANRIDPSSAVIAVVGPASELREELGAFVQAPNALSVLGVDFE